MAEIKSDMPSATPALDARLLALPGSAKLRALLSGLGITNGDVVRGTGCYAQWVAPVINGDRRHEETRQAIASALGLPMEEVESAIESSVVAGSEA